MTLLLREERTDSTTARQPHAEWHSRLKATAITVVVVVANVASARHVATYNGFEKVDNRKRVRRVATRQLRRNHALVVARGQTRERAQDTQ